MVCDVPLLKPVILDSETRVFLRNVVQIIHPPRRRHLSGRLKGTFNSVNNPNKKKLHMDYTHTETTKANEREIITVPS